MIMEICKNINTGQVFVHLDEQENNQALMITPQGIVKALEYDLFSEPVEVEDKDALNKVKSLQNLQSIPRECDAAMNGSLTSQSLGDDC
jgi:hypothetical protein